jgi:hypothetical protein
MSARSNAAAIPVSDSGPHTLRSHVGAGLIVASLCGMPLPLRCSVFHETQLITTSPIVSFVETHSICFNKEDDE